MRFLALICFLLALAISAFFGGWLFMLALGAAHSYVPAVPAAGYWACYIVWGFVEYATSNASYRHFIDELKEDGFFD